MDGGTVQYQVTPWLRPYAGARYISVQRDLLPDYAQTMAMKMYNTRGKCEKGGFNESPITGLAYGGRPDLLV